MQLSAEDSSKGGKFAFIDRTGKVIIPPQEFEEVDPVDPADQIPNFSAGLAPIETVKGKFVFVDPSGKAATPATYNNAYNFSEGLAAVKVGYRWGYINRWGKVVWQSD